MLGPGAFRLILALLVFVAHTSVFNVGRAAVMVFFILSGYWVGRLYAQRRGSVWAYLLDRWLRVWPLLMFVSLGWMAAQRLLGLPVSDGLLSTIVLIGLTTRHTAVLDISWSLDIEVQFYLALPVAQWIIARLRPGQRAAFAIVGIAVMTIGGFWLMSLDVWTAFAFAPAFGVGVALYRTNWQASGSFAALSVVLFMATGLLLSRIPAMAHVVIQPSADWFYFPWLLAWTLLLVPFVAWNLHQPSPPLDRVLGDLSFPFYLLHAPVITLTGLLAPQVQGMAHKGLALIASLLMTVIVYYAFDRPIERWRVRLRDRLVHDHGVSPVSTTRA